MAPQVDFLDFITIEARNYPHFQFQMGATVQEFITKNGYVRGVRYRAVQGDRHEVHTPTPIEATVSLGCAVLPNSYSHPV